MAFSKAGLFLLRGVRTTAFSTAFSKARLRGERTLLLQVELAWNICLVQVELAPEICLVQVEPAAFSKARVEAKNAHALHWKQ